MRERKRERERESETERERERERYGLVIILENFKIQAYSVYVID